ncbi:MAG: fused isobutyryl-CoA mutase/GTPase IcmF, partial [Planctomycetota bacterium]
MEIDPEEARSKEREPVYRPKHKLRFVTAASLFDGHDASINIIRRILQASGVEVIHLGHNRSALEIVTAAVQEDVQAIAVSCYQGGHNELFAYLVQLLRERGANVRVFGGGGGVIVPDEIAELHRQGVTRIYSPDDGRKLGLQGIINDMIERSDFATVPEPLALATSCVTTADWVLLGKLITTAEMGYGLPGARVDQCKAALRPLLTRASAITVPVIGITGTGGAGKSSLTDEIVRRYLEADPNVTIAILSVDPSKRKTGGALLGDRIRMNAVDSPRVYMRSFASRGSANELSAALGDAILLVKAAGFDLVFVETSGIGQGDSAVVDLADLTIYAMTSEFGAPTQLEKIDMLDYADLIVLNKCERPGSADALRELRKQYRRSRNLFSGPADDDLPVFATTASRFNDPGVNALFGVLARRAAELRGPRLDLPPVRQPPIEERRPSLIPAERTRYLADVARTCRDYRRFVEEQVTIARRLHQLKEARVELERYYAGGPTAGDARQHAALADLEHVIAIYEGRLDATCRRMLDGYPELKQRYAQDRFKYQVRDEEHVVELATTTLAGTRMAKVAFPRSEDPGDILRFLLLENVPGGFPYAAGVFPFKRQDEDPKRQFAGEGPPERTNKRFHYLSRFDQAKRLSTAFDSVTLYGDDPDERPDIYGKVGESGVSICTLDDMKKLYAGFDLCDPNTSVSMTINGPAPIILAMFLNTAIDQQLEKMRSSLGRELNDEDVRRVREATLRVVRGTVQADILKEDQAQNTCIFSTEFALKLMGDVQEYFIQRKVRNYYSVSISGYHIAEAGANPITQLAFTLANGFTYVEYYLARGMKIDDFAPNFSFFFSNGLDPEYTVLGRVARRIWAAAMRYRYGANERSQKLKYHIQTSGRSLHAQEIDFNDIRTTLQALMAYFDNCNSLHTNAYDEAITTPTEGSVRRAMAIQLIITKELGWTKNE